jgi:hypothetical protein
LRTSRMRTRSGCRNASASVASSFELRIISPDF